MITMIRQFAVVVIAFAWLVLVDRSEAGCRTVFCPPAAVSFSCDKCAVCLQHASRFCYTSDNATCGCATLLPASCSPYPAKSLIASVYCFILDDVLIPPPEVLPHDAAVSVVVPRFFTNPPFDVFKPTFLYLMAFFAREKLECVPVGHIEAYPRRSGCLLRVRLHMPNIDYTGKDNYYYDDRSPLESQFSRDIFGNSTDVKFWAEVTVNQAQNVSSGVVNFATILKSAKVIFPLV